MKTAASILTLLVAVLLFEAQIRALRLRAPDRDGSGYIYSHGNAPDPVRAAVLATLREFQRGYELRDSSMAPRFSERLFAGDALILGTQPREVHLGREEAAELIGEDWESWGDCTFDVDRTHVSVNENVAWFATTGRVRFDLSRFLVVPLRLSGVMVREAGGWKIRYLQYQFDLDNSFSLLILFVLVVWIAVLAIVLVVRAGRYAWRLREYDPATLEGKRKIETLE